MYAYGSSEFPPIYSVYFVTMIDIFRVCSHNQIYLPINQFLSYIIYMKYIYEILINLHLYSNTNRECDCFLMPTQQLFSYTMVRTS
jgi:hypothetical protein